MTTYPPLLINVVCERPLMQNKSWHSKSFFFQTFFFARQKLIKKAKNSLTWNERRQEIKHELASYRKTKHFCLAKDLKIKADSFEEDRIFQFTLNFFWHLLCSAAILASCRSQKAWERHIRIIRPSSKKSALHKDLKDV